MNENDHIKQNLNQICENLDQDTMDKLDSIREKALSSNQVSHRFFNFSWPIFGPAIAALLIVVFVVSNQSMDNVPKTDMFLSDLEILVIDADVEFIEDIEFYAWLDQQNLLEGELL